MLIHRTGPHIAMYIDGSEVTANGWGELDEARLRELADEALGELGLTEMPPRVIESYAAADGGALVFVRLEESAPAKETPEAFFAFPDADTLLDALRACGIRASETGIFQYGGQYVLALPGAIPAFRVASARLCEFGVRLCAGKLARAMLEEHGG